MDHLSEGLGHLDRHAGLKGYCTGLMLPLARKSVGADRKVSHGGSDLDRRGQRLIASTTNGAHRCWRRPNFEPLCRPNIEPGWEPTLRWSAVDEFRSLAGSATSV